MGRRRDEDSHGRSAFRVVHRREPSPEPRSRRFPSRSLIAATDALGVVMKNGHWRLPGCECVDQTLRIGSGQRALNSQPAMRCWMVRSLFARHLFINEHHM